MRVRRRLLTLLTGMILALGVSGCLEIPTPNALGVTQTATIQPTATPEPTETTALIIPDFLWVRDAPGGKRVDWLELGQAVTVLGCKDNWCQIQDPPGWVFRGCLSGNNDLGCQAR